MAGIPTLVFIDGETGKLITSDGREKVTSDAEAKNFPWYPKKLCDILQENEGKLKTKDGETTVDAATAGKVTGLYFSAHWVRDEPLNVCVEVQMLSTSILDQI